ncbi:hypothetical protein ATY36_18000 [Vibrio cidicii]|uniref:oligosaccharide flippase family protein n=1 Tax=Vibrio cidicii TaxID=1763883 RepID=UPI00077FF23E|nr:oligosaccharide flippase family protein [Vibrio cidicii]KYN80525.1 hypothetical protein ATY36_18000 [Vibrio cidicii]
MNQARILKNIKYMFTSSIGTQIINLATLPVLTRYYSPEAWGQFSIYLATLGVLSIVCTLSYSGAIITSKRDFQARLIARGIIFLSGFFGLLQILLLLINYKLLLIDFDGKYVYIIPGMCILACFQDVLYSLISRKMLFKYASVVMVVSTLISVSSSFFASFYFDNEYGLIIGNFILYAFQVLGFTLALRINNVRIFKVKYNACLILREFKKNIDFAIYKFPQNLLSNTSQNLPVIIFGNVFGAYVSGQYAMARKLVGIPSLLMGRVLSRVFFSEIAYSVNSNIKIFSTLLRTSLILFILSLPVFISIYLFGQEILTFILGEQWSQSGKYSGYLGLWLLAALVNKPVTSAIPALGLQKEFLIYEISLFLFRTASLIFFSFIYKDIDYSIISFSIVGMVFNISLMMFVLYFVYNKERKRE